MKLPRNTALNIALPALILLSTTVSSASSLVTEPQGQVETLAVTHEKPFNVFVCGPEDATRGLLLIHGWMGLDDAIKDRAREFGDAGYRVMAIDLYDGRVATEPKGARALMEGVRQSDANAKYVAALSALKGPGRDLAVIGWSFGGSQAVHAALSAPDLVSATVAYYPYGDMPADAASLSRLRGPLLIQVGTQDFSFTPDKAKAYAAAMEQANKTLTVATYDAKHSFDSETSLNYDQTADEQARFSTARFLDRYLD